MKTKSGSQECLTAAFNFVYMQSSSKKLFPFITTGLMDIFFCLFSALLSPKKRKQMYLKQLLNYYAVKLFFTKPLLRHNDCSKMQSLISQQIGPSWVSIFRTKSSALDLCYF